MVRFHDDIAVLVLDVKAGEATLDPVLKSFYQSLSVSEGLDPGTGYLPACSFNAVSFPDDELLRNINKTSCKITGIGCTKCRIRKTFSCAVS